MKYTDFEWSPFPQASNGGGGVIYGYITMFFNDYYLQTPGFIVIKE